MILATRGWGPEAFARAKPDFMDAARWALWTERAVPIWQHQREIQAVPTKDATPEVLAAKLDAQKIVPLLTELLWPKDE